VQTDWHFQCLLCQRIGWCTETSLTRVAQDRKRRDQHAPERSAAWRHDSRNQDLADPARTRPGILQRPIDALAGGGGRGGAGALLHRYIDRNAVAARQAAGGVDDDELRPPAHCARGSRAFRHPCW
jgi:hypothetical protein